MNEKVLDSVRNLVDYVQITLDSTDSGKSLVGFFYLKGEKKLELAPKAPTVSQNWEGYIEIVGNIPVLHLYRIAGVWIDLIANINRRIKTVEFFVPDMGEARVTFNFRYSEQISVREEEKKTRDKFLSKKD